MDMIAAFRGVGTYRGAAAMCGFDPKTIKRGLARLAAGDVSALRREPERNYDVVRDVVAARVKKTSGKISAKRLLPEEAGLVSSESDSGASVVCPDAPLLVAQHRRIGWQRPGGNRVADVNDPLRAASLG